MAAKDYTNIGSKFGLLEVIGVPEKDKHHIYKVRCRCECGMESITSCRQLVIGKTKSCGCLRKTASHSQRIELPIGYRYGLLTVVKYIDNLDGKKRAYQCICDCGNAITVKATSLIGREKKSCGCLVGKVQREKHPIKEGERFGMVTIVGDAAKNGKNRKVFALCDCGNRFVVAINNLRTGHTISCGCAKVAAGIAKTTHGYTKKLKFNKTYSIYRDMRTRCENQKYKEFYLYGGRGIKVCERWHSFEKFLEDMGDRPSGKTLDRIDSNGNYEPSNCRWATPIEQGSNKRNNIYLDYDGKRQTVAQWSRELGILDKTIYYRIKRGWSPEMALSKP